MPMRMPKANTLWINLKKNVDARVRKITTIIKVLEVRAGLFFWSVAGFIRSHVFIFLLDICIVYPTSAMRQRTEMQMQTAFTVKHFHLLRWTRKTLRLRTLYWILRNRNSREGSMEVNRVRTYFVFYSQYCTCECIEPRARYKVKL